MRRGAYLAIALFILLSRAPSASAALPSAARFNTGNRATNSLSFTVRAGSILSLTTSRKAAVGEMIGQAIPNLSKTAFSFGTPLNIASAAQTATLSNLGDIPLGIGSFALSSTEFVVTDNNCLSGGTPVTLAPGASCTFSLVFQPTIVSAVLRIVKLTISFSTTATTQVITLSGSVIVPTYSLSTTSLVFNSVVGVATAAQTVTLSNTGQAPLTINAITIPSVYPFAVTSNTCVPDTSPATLDVGGFCTFAITFKPVWGTLTQRGVLTVSAAPLAVSKRALLTGTVTPPTYTLSPSSLSFAEQLMGTASPVQTVILTNTSPLANLTISRIIPPVNWILVAETGSCQSASTLPPGANCSINLALKPITAGAKTGLLYVLVAAPGVSRTVPATGTGVAPLVVAPTTMVFGPVVEGTTKTMTLTLTNPANNPTLNGVSINFSGSGDFGRSGTDPGTCGTTVAGGVVANTCTINVVYAPLRMEANFASDAAQVTIVGAQGQVSQNKIVSLRGLAEIGSITVTPATGPLVASSNANFFKTPVGKTIVLAGSHTWSTMQDTSEADNLPAFDFNAYVSFLVNHGHNATILWHKDLPTYCGWGADGGGTTWHMTMWPWNRTGPGNASDGLPRFDLNSINQAFYDQLRARVNQLQQNGIYAIVQFFDGLGLAANRCPADGYPLTGSNNINGVDDGGGVGSMTMTSANAITAVQEAYVEHLIDAINDMPNVIWEISEEAPSESGAWWSGFMIDLAHTYEKGGTFTETGEVFPPKGFSHPVLYPTLQPLNDDTGLANSNADAIAPAARIANTSYLGTGVPAQKVVINDSDHSYYGSMWTDPQQTVRNYIWENFTNGNGVLYMDPYDIWWPTNNRNLCDNNVRPTSAVCSAIVSNASSWQENVRRNLGYIVAYSDRLDLTLTTPQPSLCSTTFCLANNVAAGSEFLIYDPTGAAFTVNLSSQSGTILKVEWFDPSSGTTYPAPNYTATSSTAQSFTPDPRIATDAVLYLVDVNGHQ